MGETKKLVLKIQINKSNGQKFVNIPKNEREFLGDDYIVIKKVVDNNK